MSNDNIRTDEDTKDQTDNIHQVHAARTWEPEELERVLEGFTRDLEDEKNPCEVFAQAVELDVPLKELGMLIAWVRGQYDVRLPWISALKVKGWQTCELRALYRSLCFEQLDYDRRPSLTREWVHEYLLNFNTYGEDGELEELFGADDQSSFVEFVRAAATEIPEEFEKVLDSVLRFRVRRPKPRPGQRREPLTCRDAELFEGLVPWLSFEQREEIRWVVVRNIRIIHDVNRFFGQFSKEQRFATTNLTSHVPNVEFAGRMLLEYFPYYYRGAGEYFTRLISRAVDGPGEKDGYVRTPDVYRALLHAGDQGAGKPNRWLTSEFEKWWQEVILAGSGWLVLTLTSHESPNSGRINLQATAPDTLRVQGLPPKLVMSLSAGREDGGVVHRTPLPGGGSFILRVGERVMVRRDFHRSTVAHRTHDTAIFHARPTSRAWHIQHPWPTDVMIPLR